MNTPRSVLIIEDKSMQFRPMKEDLENAGWQISRAIDEASAWQGLEREEVVGRLFDAILLDLGLPPDIDNPLRAIPLAAKLRGKYPRMPILAYTALAPTGSNADYARLISALLPLGISFAYLRKLPEDVSISVVLDLVWRGFHILGPGTSSFLPEAVADLPDPLETDHWDTLRLLSQGLIDRQIADKLILSEAGVRNRISNVWERLTRMELLSMEERVERRALVEWYRSNRVRYRRP